MRLGNIYCLSYNFVSMEYIFYLPIQFVKQRFAKCTFSWLVCVVRVGLGNGQLFYQICLFLLPLLDLRRRIEMKRRLIRQQQTSLKLRSISYLLRSIIFNDFCWKISLPMTRFYHEKGNHDIFLYNSTISKKTLGSFFTITKSK